jgi:hypothetical protein
MPPYYGKFRGIVLDNDDPLRLGRVQVQVPRVLNDVAVWAMPCAPYSPEPPGPSEMPQIGSRVWVEFEEGNLDYPVWTGCFWAER